LKLLPTANARVFAARRLLFIAAALATAGIAVCGDAIKPLESDEPCNRCGGALLPGSTQPHPASRWGIISDLPESFDGYGVLYATTPVLPAGSGAPPSALQQIAAPDFRDINGSFDVFLFHLMKGTTATARLVVYAKNVGRSPVTVTPQQVIKSEGVIGTVHQFESDLARRVMAGDWDTTSPSAVKPVTLSAGEGAVIAAGKQFGGGIRENTADASRNPNCFGYVRAAVKAPEGAHLQVYVIAIPAGLREDMTAEAEKWLQVGARSTDQVPMDKPLTGCSVGRAVGVYPNFTWQNAPFTWSASSDEPTTFPIALPLVQTAGCADARQTTDLALRLPVTRTDTIGNYMIEYRLALSLDNPGAEPRRVQVAFGKPAADIGLAWAAEVRPGAVDAAAVDFDSLTRIKTAWAGPKQNAFEKPLIEEITLQPGEKKTAVLRFMICGNSSLPFYLKLSASGADQ